MSFLLFCLCLLMVNSFIIHLKMTALVLSVCNEDLCFSSCMYADGSQLQRVRQGTFWNIRPLRRYHLLNLAQTRYQREDFWTVGFSERNTFQHHCASWQRYRGLLCTWRAIPQRHWCLPQITLRNTSICLSFIYYRQGSTLLCVVLFCFPSIN